MLSLRNFIDVYFFRPLKNFFSRLLRKGSSSTKSCTVYRKDGNLYVVTTFKTDTGLLLENLPIYRLPEDDAVLFDKLIRESLEISNRIVPIPNREETASTQKLLLKNLQERSFKRLYTKAKACGILIAKAEITVSPYITDNPRRGMREIADRRARFDDDENGLNLAIAYLRECLFDHRD